MPTVRITLDPPEDPLPQVTSEIALMEKDRLRKEEGYINLLETTYNKVVGLAHKSIHTSVIKALRQFDAPSVKAMAIKGALLPLTHPIKASAVMRRSAMHNIDDNTLSFMQTDSSTGTEEGELELVIQVGSEADSEDETSTTTRKVVEAPMNGVSTNATENVVLTESEQDLMEEDELASDGDDGNGVSLDNEYDPLIFDDEVLPERDAVSFMQMRASDSSSSSGGVSTVGTRDGLGAEPSFRVKVGGQRTPSTIVKVKIVALESKRAAEERQMIQQAVSEFSSLSQLLAKQLSRSLSNQLSVFEVSQTELKAIYNYIRTLSKWTKNTAYEVPLVATESLAAPVAQAKRRDSLVSQTPVSEKVKVNKKVDTNPPATKADKEAAKQQKALDKETKNFYNRESLDYDTPSFIQTSSISGPRARQQRVEEVAAVNDGMSLGSTYVDKENDVVEDMGAFIHPAPSAATEDFFASELGHLLGASFEDEEDQEDWEAALAAALQANHTAAFEPLEETGDEFLTNAGSVETAATGASFANSVKKETANVRGGLRRVSAHQHAIDLSETRASLQAESDRMPKISGRASEDEVRAYNTHTLLNQLPAPEELARMSPSDRKIWVELLLGAVEDVSARFGKIYATSEQEQLQRDEERRREELKKQQEEANVSFVQKSTTSVVSDSIGLSNQLNVRFAPSDKTFPTVDELVSEMMKRRDATERLIRMKILELQLRFGKAYIDMTKDALHTGLTLVMSRFGSIVSSIKQELAPFTLGLGSSHGRRAQMFHDDFALQRYIDVKAHNYAKQYAQEYAMASVTDVSQLGSGTAAGAVQPPQSSLRGSK